ncbi:MAG: hypothetical protein WCI97_10755 [Bacteroidota bacterium]
MQIKLYINKLYVDLTGGEPDSVELQNQFAYLKTNELSVTARTIIADQLLNAPEFYSRLFDLTSADMTNGIDTSDIHDEINQFYSFIYYDSINGYPQNIPYYNYEINRMVSVYTSANDLLNNTISLREFYRLFMDNYFYDQVNMGTENFVKGSFDDFYLRIPTTSELQLASDMVDGAPSTLFDQSGSSKTDYENILVNSPEFTEGFIRKCYRQYLLRNPTSGEMGLATQAMNVSMDWKAMIKNLVVTDEYAGF